MTRVTAVCVSTINIVAPTVGIGRTIVGARPEHGVPHKPIPVCPEGIKIGIRPECEGQEIAEEVRPEDWSDPSAPAAIPAAPSTVPAAPAGLPIRIAPLIPGCLSGERTFRSGGESVGSISPRRAQAGIIEAPCVPCTARGAPRLRISKATRTCSRRPYSLGAANACGADMRVANSRASIRAP